MPTPLLDLSKVLDRPEVCLVSGGPSYKVAPINALMLRMYQSFAGLSDDERVLALYDLAKLILPDVDATDIESLGMEQITMLIDLAMDPVKAAETYAATRVDARRPNANGDGSRPDSSRTTSSVTAVSGSRGIPVGALKPSSQTPSRSRSTPTP